MDSLNLDPEIGEEVRWGFQPGVFKIVHVRRPGDEHPNPNLQTPISGFGTVDLKREGSAFIHEGVPWAVLRYVDETRLVRRTIEWLRTNPKGLKYPEYVVDYEVEAGTDHEGNPAIFVRFLVNPGYVYEDGRPSETKISAFNQFLYDVQQELLGLDLDRWIYVRAGEARGALDVAS